MSTHQDLMHKHASFAITTTIILTAIVTVTLYAINAANAQGNSTGAAAKNMTNATGAAAKNMTGVAESSCVKVSNREEC